jgi:hypothetical protein
MKNINCQKEKSYELIKKISMKKIIILLSFILLVTFTAKSQISILDETQLPVIKEKETVSLNHFIGLTGGGGLVSYTGSFLLFGNEVDCDPYNFKTNTEFQKNLLFGLRTEWKISRHFGFYASLLYEDRSAKFDPLDKNEPVYLDDEKYREPARFNQQLDGKINIFSVSPMVKYKPFDFDIGILVGPSFAYIVLDELDAKESILEPEELAFTENDGKERTIYSGKIESKNSFLLDLKFGLSCGFMITKKIKLSPEIFYVLPLTEASSEDDWKISFIQFLIGLSYGF